jgi:hypothetical protein
MRSLQRLQPEIVGDLSVFRGKYEGAEDKSCQIA